MHKRHPYSQHQHGFRPGHSTLTALWNLTDELCKQIDKGNVVGIVTLDLEKAFDLIAYDVFSREIKLSWI